VSGFIKFIDASQVYRNLTAVNAVINQQVAEALADGLEEEFTRLVIETPQWTGTAAASWNVAVGAASEDEPRVQPERERKHALSAGRMAAVSVALNANHDRFEEFKKSYTLRNLAFYNNAPSIETAEEGPLRPQNIPPGTGAFERFKLRVQGRAYQTYKDFEI